MTGLTLAQYRIDAELGRGGMGIVYKATDSKLNRTVALKVLPAAALSSEDDRARFFREAQAAAKLHHPNIATVFQIDEAIPVGEDGESVGATDGPRPFIAMEFVEGETISDLIKKAPFPLSQAVSIAGQVAEALKEAHGKDVVHRDIKSANVMLTPDGVAKVLDFGLAKTNQSTMLTRMGSTLGTVAYMSPEQARGQEVDGRTDLYALGTMLYEMVAGRLPFAGDYEQAVLYSILNEPPEPLTALRTGVPIDMERVVSKLLSKEAEYRYQSAAGLLADLKSLDLTGSGHSRRSMAAVPLAQPVRKSQFPIWGWGAIVGAAIFGFAVAFVFAPRQDSDPSNGPIVLSNIDLAAERIPRALSVSPDGSLLAYADASGGQVWIRDLETGAERAVPNALNIIELDFSPDGQWLLLDEQNAILRAPIAGGSPVRLHDIASNAPHSSWVDDETILYDDARSIFELSLIDGSIRAIATADTSLHEVRLLWGRVSPDGSRMFARAIRDPQTPALNVYAYPSGELLAREDWDAVAPRYQGSGHLLALEDSDLMARPFDLKSASFTGAPVRIAESISEYSWDISEWGQLFFAPVTSFQFSSSSTAVPEVTLIRGRGTTRLPIEVPAERYADLRVSPDGTRLALEILDRGAPTGDAWVIDLDSNIREQVTFGDSGDEPVWSPDGDSLLVVNRTFAARSARLEVLAADGSGSRRVVFSDSTRLESPAWSASAGLIIVVRINAGGGRDLWFVDPLSGEARPAVEDLAIQSLPDFSPDGRYFAFESDQSILVRSTSLDGSEWDISQGSGETPRWAPDGSGIYFTDSGRILFVPATTEGRFRRLAAAEIVADVQSTALYYSPIPGSDDLVFVNAPTMETGAERISVRLMSNAVGALAKMAPVNH